MDKRTIVKQGILVLVLVAFLLEIILRVFGFSPGQIYKNQWVNKVNKLQVYNTFMADSFGVFKVNTSVLDSISQVPANEVGVLYRDHENLPQNSYNNFIKTINNKNKKSEFEKAVLQYNSNPINHDGFYSIPFQNFPNETKKTVLLLGDSFTWGHSTNNKTSSFANELLAKGYIVYNTGISAVDVDQYEEIAKQYIPKLKPDIVILNFFMGNDIEYYKRTLEAYHPVYYGTNAGNIIAFQNGIEFYTAKEAYENLINQMYLRPKTFSQKVIVQSSLLTQIWKVGIRFGLSFNFNNIPQGEVLEKPACNGEIKNILKICKENNSKLELVVIPDYLYGKTNVEDFPFLFENIDYTISTVPEKYYIEKDGHYNDGGHFEYAEFLDSIIKTK